MHLDSPPKRVKPRNPSTGTVRIRYLVPTRVGMEVFQDRLDAVGVPVGIFLAIVGLGNLVGQPWQYAAGGAPIMVLQIIGSLAAIAIGVGLVYLVHFVE